MSLWRTIFEQMKSGVELEKKLSPTLKTYDGKLSSTAQTDINKKIIHLDVSQAPLKTAMSYAYELKNLENVPKYKKLTDLASSGKIEAAQYVHGCIEIEADAVHFRTKVFFETGQNIKLFPCNPEYLKMYSSDLSEEERTKQYATYIEYHGIVRHQFSASKYYLDQFSFLSGQKDFPVFYSSRTTLQVQIVTDESKKEQEDTVLRLAPKH